MSSRRPANRALSVEQSKASPSEAQSYAAADEGLVSTMRVDQIGDVIGANKNGDFYISHGTATVTAHNGKLETTLSAIRPSNGADTEQAIKDLKTACSPNGDVAATSATPFTQTQFDTACKIAKAYEGAKAVSSYRVPTP